MKFSKMTAALLVVGLGMSSAWAQQSMRLAHGLNDKHPVHLAMVKFAELAKQSPIATPEKQLRLINGYYSGGEPAPGQLVKVVDAF